MNDFSRESDDGRVPAFPLLNVRCEERPDTALPSHFRVPQLESIPVRVFWFPEPAFSSGVDTVAIDKVQVRLYSPEKTLADCFKYRNKIGLDVAVEALRLYREQVRRPNAHLLLKYEQICRVDKIMRPYIEAIL